MLRLGRYLRFRRAEVEQFLLRKWLAYVSYMDHQEKYGWRVTIRSSRCERNVIKDQGSRTRVNVETCILGLRLARSTAMYKGLK
jgi:hypothetical protein